MSSRRRLSCSLRALFVWTFLINSIINTPALAQREKLGCYEALPLSCDSPRANPLEIGDIKLEDVCRYLQVGVFKAEEVVYNVSLHEDYLNAIDAYSDLCSWVQLAYSQCFFCADPGYQAHCKEDALAYTCGGDKRTQVEVLWSQEDEVYARLQTEADVKDTCDDLLIASKQPFPYNFPSSIDLCERQDRVKHLCPGTCDGTCFDSTPSCNPDDYKGPINSTLDNFRMCDEIRYKAFYNASIDALLNISAHPEYLRAIHNDDGETINFCNNAKQAYSHCSWCASSLCFDEDHPPSCEAPPVGANYSSLEDTTADAVCHDIYWALYDINFPDDLYNTSSQTGKVLMPEDTLICEQSRQVYHQCYWCAPDVPVDFCLKDSMCYSNVTIPDDFVSHNLQTWLNFTTDTPERYCDEIFKHWQASFAAYSMQTCYEDIHLARLCPDQFCPRAEAPEQPGYLGATTDAQKRALIWASRASAALTFLGASYILYDILTNPQSRRMVYHQLLIGMAIFDIFTAAAWAFATAPIPKEEASHILGAMGTETTCTIQGFFVQLGFTSVFYNVSLAIYYVLVVAFDWREFQLKKVRMYLHVFPLALGFGLALGAIPSYHWIEYGCHLLPPPEGEFWVVIVFVVLPLGLSIIAITESMFLVYWKVRQRSAASKRWSFGVGNASKLQQAVFWQCLLYALAFYISWPILFAVYLASVDVNGPLPLTMMVAFVAPLQGFTNFLVYLRPRMFKLVTDRRGRASSRSLWRKVLRVSQVHESTTHHASETDRGMDPSAALALQDAITTTESKPAVKTLNEISEEGPRDSEKTRGASSNSSNWDFDSSQAESRGAISSGQATCGRLAPGDCRVFAVETVEPMPEVLSDAGTVRQSNNGDHLFDLLDTLSQWNNEEQSVDLVSQSSGRRTRSFRDYLGHYSKGDTEPVEKESHDSGADCFRDEPDATSDDTSGILDYPRGVSNVLDAPNSPADRGTDLPRYVASVIQKRGTDFSKYLAHSSTKQES